MDDGLPGGTRLLPVGLPGWEIMLTGSASTRSDLASAMTAIPPVRSASGNKFLTAKTGDTITAIPGKDLYFYLINEFHICPEAMIPITDKEIYSGKKP